MNTKQVVQINSALGSPMYINVSQLDNPTINTVVTEAIKTLTTQGKPLEAQQLAQLFEHHQIYNANQVHTKGTLWSALAKTTKSVGDQTVELAQIELVTAHSGGGVDVEKLITINPSFKICLNCEDYPGLFSMIACKHCVHLHLITQLRKYLLKL